MLNNINDDSKNNLLQSSLFESTYGTNNIRFVNKNAYVNNPYSQSLYIDKTEVSNEAMQLIERDNDIKKFTKIAMSDSENLSHFSLMENLFEQGVSDPFGDDILADLSANSALWDDIGL